MTIHSGHSEIDCDDINGLTGAGNLISKGKTVVYPTDTVYGLGTNPLSEEGLMRCFKIKKRELGKPFPVLFSSLSRVREFVIFDKTAEDLAKGFWPGKITIVLQAQPKAGLSPLLLHNGTLGVRIPNHECARKLIESCGGVLVGTSANLSGEKSFTRWDDPGLQKVALNADFLVKGTCGNDTRPSTIIDLSLPLKPKIIREGAINASEISSYLSRINKAAFSASK